MGEIVIRLRIPDEFDHLKEKIEENMKAEVERLVKRLEIVERTKGCLKTDKTWEELKAEIYDGIYKHFFCR